MRAMDLDGDGVGTAEEVANFAHQKALRAAEDIQKTRDAVNASGEINPSTWLQCAPIRPLSTTIPRRASSVGLQLPFRPKTSEIGRDTAEI